MLETLGVRLQVGPGETALPPGLVVCNHISWLDIYVINALTPVAFVSKDDLKHWPLIGWLCAHTETIFLERGSRAAAQRARATMIGYLRAGVHVAVFPEGTTSDGACVLPFHAALLQSAIDAHMPVLPVALRYVDGDGYASRAPAYDGDITMAQSLWAIARADGLCAQPRVLDPLAFPDRRALATRSRELIAWHVGQRKPAGASGLPCNDEAAASGTEIASH